jgi:AcrR family transcriptional regulator
LHVWVAGSTVLAGVPESVRKTGLGGVGYLIDGLAPKSRNRHTVSKVRMDGWQRYRIEPVRSPGSPAGERRGPQVTGCDGSQYWEAHEDRVDVGKSRPAPADLADLTDTSLLLGCELSGGEPVTFDGHPAFRLSVRGGPAQSQLLWPGLPAVAVMDAETGRLIRLTCYANGEPACRYELRDVTPAPEGADEDTGYAVPPGLPIETLERRTEARRAARDSRKQATREALREEAMRLALERGPGNVGDADIAAAAGVPLRVYQSCFSGAEQAIVAAVVDEQKARLVSAVAARPPRVPLRRAITDAIMEAYASPGVRRSREMQFVLTHPALRAEYLKTAGMIEGELTAVIAERLGTDRRDVAYPAKMVAAQVQGVLKHWLKSVGAPASGDEFPTRPLAWRLRLSFMMFGRVLDDLESQARKRASSSQVSGKSPD